MNTINPGAISALEQDSQKYLDAVYELHQFRYPRHDKLMALIDASAEQMSDTEAEASLARAGEILGTDPRGVILYTLNYMARLSQAEAAERGYLKTRSLVESFGN